MSVIALLADKVMPSAVDSNIPPLNPIVFVTEPLPMLSAELISTAPPLIFVAPEYVLTPVSAREFVPTLVRPPVSEITPA